MNVVRNNLILTSSFFFRAIKPVGMGLTSFCVYVSLQLSKTIKTEPNWGEAGVACRAESCDSFNKDFLPAFYQHVISENKVF